MVHRRCGLGIFFYYDALPFGLAVEYSSEELNVQNLILLYFNGIQSLIIKRMQVKNQLFYYS